MPKISRRAFVQNAVTTAAVGGIVSGGALELRAHPLGMPIGCQSRRELGAPTSRGK
jgi:hypothetical protein